MIKKFLREKLISIILILTIIFPSNSTLIYAQEPELSAHYQAQTNLHGFCLKKILKLGNDPILEYKHEKSGAWLIVEKNNSIDKKFEISVRTPPENDKGTNHIIEHCILNGSREYPCKSIIWELTRAAHATFINAMTLPCYTTYPVAAVDEDELESLAKIYTSGIFHPMFLEDERIFKKEGIRYELDETGNLRPNGTVFNEMQNESQMYLNLMIKRIFPDTQSKNLSGGIPQEIMDLTYEEVCETYKKYYTPSNMVIQLKGDIDYEKIMQWLDADYLSKYNSSPNNFVKYTNQSGKSVAKYKTVDFFQISGEKSLINVSAAYILSDEFFKENREALRIINSILSNPTSERTNFLKEKGYLACSAISTDIFYDPVCLIQLLTSDHTLTTQSKAEETLREMFEKYPINQSEIDSVLNGDYFDGTLLKSIQFCQESTDSSAFVMSFIKYGDPCSEKYFDIGPQEEIDLCDSQRCSLYGIQKTLKKTILDAKPIITVIAPSKDSKLSVASKISEKTKLLENRKDELTKNYIEQRQWAQSPNEPEKVALIKNMFKKLSKIKIQHFECPFEQDFIKGKSLCHSSQEIGKFISYKFPFKINHLTDEDKKYLEIFIAAFNSFETKNYSSQAFESEKSGKVRINLKFKIDENVQKEQDAFLILNVVCPKENSYEAFHLLDEQMNNLNFKSKKSLSDFLNARNLIYTSQSPIASKYMYAFLKNCYENNYITGNRSLQELQDFYDNIFSNLNDDEFMKNFSQKLTSLKNKIFNFYALQGVGTCCTEQNKSIAISNAKDFIGTLSKEAQNVNVKISFPPIPHKTTAFVDPSLSNNEIICLMDSKELYNDITFNITCKILNSSFLMPQIREKNGAYGASISLLPGSDKIIMNSNKDSNILSTLQIFKTIPKFLQTQKISSEEIEDISKSILGPLFEKNKLSLASNQLEQFICWGKDYCKALNQSIERIKKCSPLDIARHGEILKNLVKNLTVYVITGNLNDSEKELFDEIIQ